MARGGASGGTPGDVGEFTMLKSQPGSEDALMILKKIHSVSPSGTLKLPLTASGGETLTCCIFTPLFLAPSSQNQS